MNTQNTKLFHLILFSDPFSEFSERSHITKSYFLSSSGAQLAWFQWNETNAPRAAAIKAEYFEAKLVTPTPSRPKGDSQDQIFYETRLVALPSRAKGRSQDRISMKRDKCSGPPEWR